jgi:hypothetical protein
VKAKECIISNPKKVISLSMPTKKKFLSILKQELLSIMKIVLSNNISMDCYVYIESIWRAEIECGMEQLIPHYKLILNNAPQLTSQG